MDCRVKPGNDKKARRHDPPNASQAGGRRLFPQIARGFGKPLEDVAAGRDKTVEGFRRSLDPLRLTLKTQPCLGGEKPNYADYIVFGAFQWACVVSPFKLLKEDDPVYAWRERLLGAFDGMARKSPGHPV